MTPETIAGSIVMMFLYDVSESIQADKLRTILGTAPGSREPFHRSQGYVAFSVPPVIEPAEPVTIDGAPGTVRVVWFEYGVMSLTIEVPFSGTWREIAELTSLWMNAPEPEREAARIREIHLNKARPALVDEYKEKLTEDYCVILLPPVPDANGAIVPAETLIAEHGRHIAQIVRGETCAFSKAELNEILQSRTCYYETDLLVVGWSSAFVYDTAEGAALSLQLLEYANSQLLEFRHYDGILTRLLSSVYRKLERGTGPLARWRLAREAERLNLIRGPGLVGEAAALIG